MSQMVQQLGRYEILAEIGRGSMGAVFQARDPKIDRIVAIKTISVAGAASQDMEQYRQRFFREAQAAGRLSAPGIVTIYDVDEDAATHTPFIVMEHVAGRTLEEIIGDYVPNKLPLELALGLIQQVAEALDYAHSHGIVHRDIKPSNIIVTEEGRAKIADFGIAKLTVADMTLPGQIVGTPAYMSPEQLNGKPIDGRSDLFSLGVIAYRLLTGEKPFAGDTLTTISFQVAYKDPRPATEANPALNPDFDYLLGRALAKEPEKRYQTGKDFSLDVEDIRAGRHPRSSVKNAEKTVIAARAVQDATVALPAATAQPRVQQLLNYVPQKLRRPPILYAVAGVVLLGLLAAFIPLGRRSTSSVPPANLQIVGQYPFRSAEMSVFVDGDLRYHGQIQGSMRKHTKFFKTTYTTEGTIALTVPLSAGNHKIRLCMKVPEQAYDEDSTIEGQFLPYGAKTLRANFSNRGSEVSWVE
jgi:serine/threonine protein kinase